MYFFFLLFFLRKESTPKSEHYKSADFIHRSCKTDSDNIKISSKIKGKIEDLITIKYYFTTPTEKRAKRN